MRIGFVSKFPEEKDGIAIYSEHLCNTLKGQGHYVVEIGDLGSTNAGYRIDFKSLLLGKKIAQIIEKEKLDILHIQHIAAGQYYSKYKLNLPVILALLQKIPVVVTLHEVQYHCRAARQMVLCMIEKAMVNGANAIIAHTPLQAGFINKKYRTDKARCIFMGVKNSKRLAKKSNKILFFGMISEGKGVEYLIEAMKLLPSYKLMVAGKAISAAYAEKLKQAAEGMKNANVKIGWATEAEKKKYLSDASMMVLPYVWAPYQSAVATDAVSYGIPIIATKVGGNWELVQEFKSGKVISHADPKAIAQAVKDVNAHYSNYLKGIEQYRKAANWDAIAKNHISLYRTLLKSQK
jgi:glycosyltransferase involved in cell wall biosynthesis